jgi:hypothetical protein
MIPRGRAGFGAPSSRARSLQSRAWRGGKRSKATGWLKAAMARSGGQRRAAYVFAVDACEAGVARSRPVRAGAGTDVAVQRSPRRQLVEIGAAPVFLLIFTGHCGAKIMREACITFGVHSRLLPLHFACICSDAGVQQDSAFQGYYRPSGRLGFVRPSASPLEWVRPSVIATAGEAKTRSNRGRWCKAKTLLDSTLLAMSFFRMAKCRPFVAHRLT